VSRLQKDVGEGLPALAAGRGALRDLPKEGGVKIASELQMALSPVDFFRTCTGFEPDPFQMEVLESTEQKVALMLSRQSGKTTVASALALHTALYDQVGETVVLLAPSLRQSTEAMTAITRMYGNLSGETVEPVVASSALRLKFQNGSRILALPGSGDATVRGPNAVMIICDEASRVEENLINACRPYLATKGKRGRLICLTTPWWKRGWFYDLWIKQDPNWLKLKADVYSNPRVDPGWLEGERLEIGDTAFRSEYLCEFLDESDAVFPEELIKAAFDNTLPALWS
jgi:hypothetical protein